MSTVGHYPTDVSDAQWDALQLLLPKRQWHPGGLGRKPMALRLVINGLFSVNQTGCQWRMIPTNIGTAHTIYGYVRRGRREGGWARGMDTLRQWERQRPGRWPEPSACCADS